MEFEPRCERTFRERNTAVALWLKLCSPLPNANCRAVLLADACSRNVAKPCSWV